MGIAFDTTFALCSNRLNYGDFDFDGDKEFDGFFPNGLEVTVEGNIISTNVYYYPEGAKYEYSFMDD